MECQDTLTTQMADEPCLWLWCSRRNVFSVEIHLLIPVGIRPQTVNVGQGRPCEFGGDQILFLDTYWQSQ